MYLVPLYLLQEMFFQQKKWILFHEATIQQVGSSIITFGQIYFQKQGIWLVFIITMFYRDSCI